jgi:hypothetical protein
VLFVSGADFGCPTRVKLTADGMEIPGIHQFDWKLL